MRDDLECLSRRLGISGSVTFHGHLKRSDVRGILDRSDLFILPSRQEGLPRSVIEAMSRGLPVIATDIGGIPELLHRDALVRPDDPQALSDKIYEFITNTELLRRMSVANVIRARDYTHAALKPRRTKFYQALAALVKK
jgi:glycosyltransferase involved in cell wall biosynthesis